MTKQSGVPESERPLKPSNDTLRITTALGYACHLEAASASSVDFPPASTVEASIRKRELRSTYVPRELLTDPAWDMLLELLHAKIVERDVTAPALCKAAGVSLSIGLRWIEVLVSKGLCTCTTLLRNPDRVFVELSEKGSQAMRGYFAEVAGME